MLTEYELYRSSIELDANDYILILADEMYEGNIHAFKMYNSIPKDYSYISKTFKFGSNFEHIVENYDKIDNHYLVLIALLLLIPYEEDLTMLRFIYEYLVKNDNIYATVELAYMFCYGIGTEKNQKRAIELILLALDIFYNKLRFESYSFKFGCFVKSDLFPEIRKEGNSLFLNFKQDHTSNSIGQYLFKHHIIAGLNLLGFITSRPIENFSHWPKRMCQKQCDIEHDYKIAKKIYKTLSKLGDGHAMYDLANLYFIYECSQKSKKAVKLLKYLSNCKFVKAQMDLALLYYSGTYVKQNHKKAVKLWEESYSSFPTEVGYYLAMAYYDGLGVQKNYKRAQELLNEIVEHGFKESYLSKEKYGLILYKLANIEYYDLARYGETIYFNAKKKYHINAINYLTEALKYTNNSYVLNLLAHIYSCDTFCDENCRNIPYAIELCEKAIEQNNVTAMFNLGEMYNSSKDHGDYKKAYKYFKMALDCGYMRAACSLAELYYYGNGIDANINEAIRLYKLVEDKCVNIDNNREYYGVLYGLYHLYYKINDYNLAFRYLLKYKYKTRGSGSDLSQFDASPEQENLMFSSSDYTMDTQNITNWKNILRLHKPDIDYGDITLDIDRVLKWFDFSLLHICAHHIMCNKEKYNINILCKDLRKLIETIL